MLAFSERIGGVQQTPARHHDALVGRHEMLGRAIGDESHAFLDRRILHADAEHAGERAARLLRHAIDQIVIAPVRHRQEAPRDQRHMHTPPSARAFQLGGAERPARMVVNVEHPAGLIITRHPGVAAARIVAIRRK